MTTLKCVLPIVCMLICLISCYDLGDSCGPNLDGKCLLVTNCETARRSLMRRRQHGLERCGFAHLIEIVCCPDKIPKPRCISIGNNVIACNIYQYYWLINQ